MNTPPDDGPESPSTPPIRSMIPEPFVRSRSVKGIARYELVVPFDNGTYRFAYKTFILGPSPVPRAGRLRAEARQCERVACAGPNPTPEEIRDIETGQTALANLRAAVAKYEATARDGDHSGSGGSVAMGSQG